MHKDYYIVLGVSRDATLDKIKKAYRTIAKKHHPDIAESPISKQRFLEVREAYDTLSDKIKRKQYDLELEEHDQRPDIIRVPDIIEARRSFFDDIEVAFTSKTDEFLEGFLPGFFNRNGGRSVVEKDLYFEAVLSPREAVEGGLYPITVPVYEPCPACKKSGLWDDFLCLNCNGYGRIRSNRQFSLSIPPNVRHGTEIQLSMEDIGLNDVYLNIVVYIDPSLEEDYIY